MTGGTPHNSTVGAVGQPLPASKRSEDGTETGSLHRVPSRGDRAGTGLAEIHRWRTKGPRVIPGGPQRFGYTAT